MLLGGRSCPLEKCQKLRPGFGMRPPPWEASSAELLPEHLLINDLLDFSRLLPEWSQAPVVDLLLSHPQQTLGNDAASLHWPNFLPCSQSPLLCSWLPPLSLHQRTSMHWSIAAFPTTPSAPAQLLVWSLASIAWHAPAPPSQPCPCRSAGNLRGRSGGRRLAPCRRQPTMGSIRNCSQCRLLSPSHRLHLLGTAGPCAPMLHLGACLCRPRSPPGPAPWWRTKSIWSQLRRNPAQQGWGPSWTPAPSTHWEKYRLPP